MKSIFYLQKGVINFVVILLMIGVQSCTKEKTVDGTVSVAVGPDCTTSNNYIGTHVFAYQESYGGGIDMLLIGGYTAGDGKEMGFYLPWPPAVGGYNLNEGLNGGYYDPVNSPNDPMNDSDQYGTIGEGSVEIISVSLNSDNTAVNSINARLNGIKVKNELLDQELCINNGVISF